MPSFPPYLGESTVTAVVHAPRAKALQCFGGSSESRCVILAFATLACSIFPAPASARDNYEIQNVQIELVAPGHTMFELHSNFTIDGSKTIVDGVYPTNHAEHETVEITHGFTDYFECGFYIFTSITEGQG